MDLLYIRHDIDIGPNFYSTLSPPPTYHLDVKVTDLQIYVKVLFGTIPTFAYDLQVKATDLKNYVKVLHQRFKIS